MINRTIKHYRPAVAGFFVCFINIFHKELVLGTEGEHLA